MGYQKVRNCEEGRVEDACSPTENDDSCSVTDYRHQEHSGAVDEETSYIHVLSS